MTNIKTNTTKSITEDGIFCSTIVTFFAFLENNDNGKSDNTILTEVSGGKYTDGKIYHDIPNAVHGFYRIG